MSYAIAVHTASLPKMFIFIFFDWLMEERITLLRLGNQ